MSDDDNYSKPMVTSGGTRYWMDRECALHRLDGPARITSKGAEEWWKHGKIHRLDGPAISFPSGFREWYQEGKRHIALTEQR